MHLVNERNGRRERGEESEQVGLRIDEIEEFVRSSTPRRTQQRSEQGQGGGGGRKEGSVHVR